MLFFTFLCVCTIEVVCLNNFISFFCALSIIFYNIIISISFRNKCNRVCTSFLCLLVFLITRYKCRMHSWEKIPLISVYISDPEWCINIIAESKNYETYTRWSLQLIINIHFTSNKETSLIFKFDSNILISRSGKLKLTGQRRTYAQPDWFL